MLLIIIFYLPKLLLDVFRILYVFFLLLKYFLNCFVFKENFRDFLLSNQMLKMGYLLQFANQKLWKFFNLPIQVCILNLLILFNFLVLARLIQILTLLKFVFVLVHQLSLQIIFELLEGLFLYQKPSSYLQVFLVNLNQEILQILQVTQRENHQFNMNLYSQITIH